MRTCFHKCAGSLKAFSTVTYPFTFLKGTFQVAHCSLILFFLVCGLEKRRSWRVLCVLVLPQALNKHTLGRFHVSRLLQTRRVRTPGRPVRQCI